MTGEKVKTRMVTNLMGHVFFVDISDEACGDFGFHFGEKIFERHSGKEGVVVGVAPSEKAEQDLWISLNGDNGNVRTVQSWEEIISLSKKLKK